MANKKKTAKKSAKPVKKARTSKKSTRINTVPYMIMTSDAARASWQAKADKSGIKLSEWVRASLESAHVLTVGYKAAKKIKGGAVESTETAIAPEVETFVMAPEAFTAMSGEGTDDEGEDEIDEENEGEAEPAEEGVMITTAALGATGSLDDDHDVDLNEEGALPA